MNAKEMRESLKTLIGQRVRVEVGFYRLRNSTLVVIQGRLKFDDSEESIGPWSIDMSFAQIGRDPIEDRLIASINFWERDVKKILPPRSQGRLPSICLK